REAREHGAQSGAISDHGRKRPEIIRYAVERLRDTCRRRPRQPGSGLPLVEIGQQIIELTKATLVLDLSAEAGSAGAGIAFERRDGGMLVLDHAGDRAEGAVGNVPCDRPPELPRRDPPGLVIWPIRDRRHVGCAEQVVEVIAEAIELTDDLGREVILTNRFGGKYRPKRCQPAGGCSPEREAFENLD